MKVYGVYTEDCLNKVLFSSYKRALQYAKETEVSARKVGHRNIECTVQEFEVIMDEDKLKA
jgi:hypothetical protein